MCVCGYRGRFECARATWDDGIFPFSGNRRVGGFQGSCRENFRSVVCAMMDMSLQVRLKRVQKNIAKIILLLFFFS